MAAQILAIREIEAEVRLAAGVAAECTVVLYGEWIGPIVQRGVATAQLPERQWGRRFGCKAVNTAR